MEDRMTHETTSVEDHGGLDDDATHSNAYLSNPGNSAAREKSLGVPYETMPARPLPAHTRNRTASSTAIPPSTPRETHQRSNSSTYPPSPSTPLTAPKSKPAVLRKDSTRSSAPNTPTLQSQPTSGIGPGVSSEVSKAQRPNKLVRGGSTSSRATATTAAHPSSPTTVAHSPTSKHAPSLSMAGTGFKYESTSYILDPPLLSSQTRARTHSHARSTSTTQSPTVPFPSNTSPQPPTPKAGIEPSSDHPNVNLTGRTEAFDERPVPYLDDLPPAQSAWWDRKPSDRPILEPYYRYCSRDGIVKPVRCHHCRICNTVGFSFQSRFPLIDMFAVRLRI